MQLDLRHILAAIRVLVLWVVGFCALLLLVFVLSLGAPALSRVPPALQLASLGLFAMSLGFLLSMFRERARTLQAFEEFASAFESLPGLKHSSQQFGLSQESMELLRKRGRSLRREPKVWWTRLEATFQPFESDNGEGWYLIEPLHETLSFDFVTARTYHTGFHQGVPPIISAAGLLCTFASILVGLGGVTYNPVDSSHPITGIDNLINGLSGKFVTSVVALLMSIVFLYCQKRICDLSVSEAYEDTLDRCRNLFPFLSPTRVLLDIRSQLKRTYASEARYAPERL